MDPSRTYFYLPLRTEHGFSAIDFFNGIDHILLFLKRLHNLRLELEDENGLVKSKEVPF